MANYDLLGNIAIVKYDYDMGKNEKKKFALKLLKDNKNIRTVLEKKNKFSGRLRTLTTGYIAGEKTKEALYKENNCIFRFNVDSCYFSPRLASERKEIANLVGKGEEVLVLFGGVAPFAIVIAKSGKAKRVVSVELGRECSKYALENVKKNKVNVEVVQGNVRKVLPGMKEKYDRIVMARPNLKDDFLDVVFPRVKKNGVIHYYGFYEEKNKEKMLEMIKERAKEAGKKIRITGVNKAGDIGVKKYRYRVDFRVD